MKKALALLVLSSLPALGCLEKQSKCMIDDPTCDLPSTAGEGGADSTTDTGSSSVECETDDDCAKYENACNVFMCLKNVCLLDGPRDDDGDGSPLCTGAGSDQGQIYDCNDNEPSIHPGADDVCGDLIDNNCNGVVDEGCFDFCVPAFLDPASENKDWWMGCCAVNGSFKEPQAPTPQPGQVFKIAGDASIYYQGPDGKSHLFPLVAIFVSWFGKQDAQGVPQMDPSTCGILTEYPEATVAAILGGNVTFRPYTFVTGIESKPARYVTAPGQKLNKLGQGVADDLFPAGSYSARIMLVPDAFFVNFKEITELNDAGDYDISAAQSVTLDQDLGIVPMP